MNKFVLLAILALPFSALLTSALQRGANGSSSNAEVSCGGITTLYLNDPLAWALDLHTGRPGMLVQESEVRNRDSQLCLGYYPDSLTVAIQGGDTGAIVDVGALREAETQLGLQPVSNGGTAFVALSADWARTKLENQALTSTAHAPIKSGHVYVARIATAGKPDLIAKLLVLEFRPGESVTLRWQKLAG